MSDMTQVNSENYILRQMDLSNNNISTLTKLAKANLTHHFAGIERLDLSLNNLQTFPEELFIVSWDYFDNFLNLKNLSKLFM